MGKERKVGGDGEGLGKVEDEVKEGEVGGIGRDGRGGGGG